METEYTVIGKINCAAITESIRFGEYEFTIRNSSIGLEPKLNRLGASNDITESELENVCKAISERFGALAYICKGKEEYGLLNVFNGGSDYEVVNEEWFLVAYNAGSPKYTAKTNSWLAVEQKINELIQ